MRLRSRRDVCAWTNTGDKSVRLAVSGQASASPVVTVLAPGERYKAPAELCAGASTDRLSYQASFPTLKVMADDTPAPVKVAVAVPKIKPAVPVATTAAAPTAKPVSTLRIDEHDVDRGPHNHGRVGDSSAARKARRAACLSAVAASEAGGAG